MLKSGSGHFWPVDSEGSDTFSINMHLHPVAMGPRGRTDNSSLGLNISFEISLKGGSGGGSGSYLWAPLSSNRPLTQDVSRSYSQELKLTTVETETSESVTAQLPRQLLFSSHDSPCPNPEVMQI